MMLSELVEDDMSAPAIEEFAISQMTERNLDYYENNKDLLTQSFRNDQDDSSSGEGAQ